MIKFIWIGIYIFGIICQGGYIYEEIKCCRYRARKILTLIYITQRLLWPIYWLKNFINYYLDDPEEYTR